MDERIKRIALAALGKNREVLEVRLFFINGAVQGHRHGRFCSPQRRCRQLEKEKGAVERLIGAHRQAEDRLKEGNARRASQLFEEMASLLEKSPRDPVALLFSSISSIGFRNLGAKLAEIQREETARKQGAAPAS